MAQKLEPKSDSAKIAGVILGITSAIAVGIGYFLSQTKGAKDQITDAQQSPVKESSGQEQTAFDETTFSGSSGGTQFAPNVETFHPGLQPAPAVVVTTEVAKQQQQQIYEDTGVQKIVLPKTEAEFFTTPNPKDTFTELPKINVQGFQVAQPNSTTAFLTEKDLPNKKVPVTEFDKRAVALAPTLSVSNPGQSSAANVTNFSRLAALGQDLSKVDILNVQNPEFLGEIKSGQGPLTEAQKRLVAAQVVAANNKTTGGKQTVDQYLAERAQISQNQTASSVKAAEIDAMARSLSKSFTEKGAKANLKALGYNHTGSLTVQQYAAILWRINNQ